MTLATEHPLTSCTERESNCVQQRSELEKILAIAAEALLPDYLYDKDLTVFTVLDAEDFLEKSEA